MNPELVPVIVAISRTTQKLSSLRNALNPLKLAFKTILALNNDLNMTSNEFTQFLADITAVATVQMFYTERYRSHFKSIPYRNFSLSLANALKLNLPKSRIIESVTGGNGPQYLINYFAEKIASGERFDGPILIGGVEVCASFDRVMKFGEDVEMVEIIRNEWKDDSVDPKEKTLLNNHTLRKLSEMNPKEVEDIGHAILHGGFKPVSAYAMIENALLHKERNEDSSQSFESLIKKRTKLFSQFSKIAESNPDQSWFSKSYESSDLLQFNKNTLPNNSDFRVNSISKHPNRMTSFPYTKLMVARDEVDMSAFVCIMSLAESRRRNISEEKLIYFHGGASGFDHQIIGLHKDLYHSKGLEYAYHQCLTASRVDVNRIDFFDIYSCFPCAVTVGLRQLELLGRKTICPDILTTTGGLPYHGGPGSNYSTHALCALVERLRETSSPCEPKYGMICANGGILSEHSCGVYSTAPPIKISFLPVKVFQPTVELRTDILGKSRILSWTVEYRKKERVGIILVENILGKSRCFATTKKASIIVWLLEENRIGDVVNVKQEEVVTFNSLQLPILTFELERSLI